MRETLSNRVADRLSTSAFPLICLWGVLLGTLTLAYRHTAWDTATFAYIGDVVLRGGVPYVDAWDIKGPAVYFLYALCIFILGKTALAIRIFDVLWQTCTALLLAKTGKLIFHRRIVGALAGVLYLAFYFSQNYWNWALTDGFLSLPLILCLWFVVRAIETDRLSEWAAAGAGLGIVALFKLPFGLLGIPVVWAALRDHRAGRAKLLERLGALAAGCGGPLALCALYFLTKGGLRDLLVSQFILAPEYVARIHSLMPAGEIERRLLRPVLYPLYVTALVGVAAIWAASGQGEKVRFLMKFIGGWLALETAILILHGNYIEYQLLPAIFPAALLFCQAVESLYHAWRTRRRHWPVVVLGALGLILLIPAEKMRQHAVYSWRAILGRESPGHDPWLNLGKYLREHTTPGDTIFVWGNAPIIYLEADRRAASRFINAYYLSVPWRRVDFRKTFLAELQANKPKYFVLARSPSGHSNVILDIDDEAEFWRFERLQRIIKADYQLEQENSLFLLFLLK